jgi:feruloyl esterase
MTNLLLAAALAVFALASPSQALAQTRTCDGLASLAVPNARVTLARTVEPGQFAPPAGRGAAGGRGGNPFAALPAFCRIAITSTPSTDSDIKIEVWLPGSGWNGKLQIVGNGGYAGNLSYPAMATALAAGYATASTDTGHSGGDPSFIPGHPEKLTDFAYRAVHETTVAAKAAVAAFYGTPQRLAYFNGCSTGGRQALTSAQRYPADFDGIIAGAPANNTARMTTMQLWSGLVVQTDPAAALPAPKRDALHKAAVAACDARDGAADGIIENPLSCRFDAKAAADLAPAQVEAANRIYLGPVSPHTRQTIFPGLAPGSELGWNGLSGDEPFPYALGFYQTVVKDAKWDPRTLDLGVDVALAERAAATTGWQAIDPNLKPFFDRGGKLLMYHGWNDPLISPYNSVDYYRGVLDATKSDPKAADSIRLFMMPGVNHCQGGVGADTWDKAAVLDRWRETGVAPAQVTASHDTNGTIDRTHPLCAFPNVAVYKGSGSLTDASNFECRAP